MLVLEFVDDLEDVRFEGAESSAASRTFVRERCENACVLFSKDRNNRPVSSSKVERTTRLLYSLCNSPGRKISCKVIEGRSL